MRYTYQIRKFFSITAAAFLSGLMLFGCTRSDVASSSQNAAGGTSAGQGVVSSTSNDQSLAGAGSGKTAETSSQPVESTASSGTQSAPTVEGQTAQNVTGTTTQSAPQSNAQNTQNSATAANAGTAQPQAQTPDDQADFDDGPDAEESFGGEFEKSDGEESVVITIVNDSQISFQFQTSGIGAMAQASGNTAVYQGDDGYTVSFDVAGDMLAVTVSGEGGEESLMNGIYYRVVDGGGNAAYADDAGTDYDEDEEMEEDFDVEQNADEDDEDGDSEDDEESW